MAKAADLIGKRFGRLTVVGRTSKPRKTGSVRVYWICQCDCGNKNKVLSNDLVGRRVVSCGCKRGTKHGHTSYSFGMSTTYQSWVRMKSRCTNQRDTSYARYGGRGITVCDRWLESFEAFLDDMGERPTGKTIDRIDNSRGYEPDNCRWATSKEQAANRQNMTHEQAVSLGKIAASKRARDKTGRFF